jgi:hypothetical protein
MRLWTLHPRYLDARGLVALWREALLARAVLRGRTRGYRDHPQLLRFRLTATPCRAINSYLAVIAAEAALRGYAFDVRKIGPVRAGLVLRATHGQLECEWQHLLGKLARRSPKLYARLRGERAVAAHPLFTLVKGEVESWERARPSRRSLRTAATPTRP